jgi:hypothetical protein
MISFAQGTLAATLAFFGIAAQAAPVVPVCTVQYAQRSVPSTDDSIGPCLDKMLWLSIYDVSGPKLVNEISYVYKSEQSNCNVDEARRQAAIDTLKNQALVLQAQGACAKVEFLL